MRLLALLAETRHLQSKCLTVLARNRKIWIELQGRGEIGIGPPPLTLVAQRQTPIVIGQRLAVIERDGAVVVGQRAVKVGLVALEIIGHATIEKRNCDGIETDRSIVIRNRPVVGIVARINLAARAEERGRIRRKADRIGEIVDGELGAPHLIESNGAVETPGGAVVELY